MEYIFHEIVKYPPSGYNKDGIYTSDDWTRLYDYPLTHQQQDSINANECLIVYNDSTVFEFGGGIFGVQYFVGKTEFLKDLH